MDFIGLLDKLARALADAEPSAGVEALSTVLQANGFPGVMLGADAPASLAGAVASLVRVAAVRAVEHEEMLWARERAQMLSDASFEGIMIHVDGDIIDANQPLCDMTGRDRSEVLGTDFMRDTLAEEDLPEVLRRMRERIEGGYLVTGIRKDGSRFRAEILTKQGTLGERPVRVSAVRDVTERERMTGLLRGRAKDACVSSRRRRSTSSLQPERRDRRSRRRRAGFFGSAKEKNIGRRILDVVAPDYHESVGAHVQQKKSGAFRSVLSNDQGERIPVEIVAVSATLDGVPARLAGIRDLREAERAESERRKLEQHMQQSQRLDSLGVLAGGIAHDFNNLLVGIIGSAELLALGELGPADRESVQAIAEAGQRAAALTSQLLAYAGRRDLGQRGPVDLEKLLGELRRLLGSTFAKKATLEFDLGPSSTVLGNRATVLQVLMNLLTNASDALGEEAGTISVTTRRVTTIDDRFKQALGAALSESGGPWVLIEVRDTGVGMAEATRTRIFEPFFSTKAKGHGLGLAACLGIVSSHNGAIHVESALGQGSTFSVLLPAADGVSQQPPARERSTLPGRVLVVDDEAVVRRQVRRILEAHGFVVLEAADGRAALAELERELPELVLLDVTMPGLDGTEVVREARKRGHRVPIVLFSGYADFPLETRLEPHTYNGFLAKPFSIDGLLGMIKKVMVR